MSIVKEIVSYEKWDKTLVEKVGEVKWAKIIISFAVACCLGNAVVFHMLLPFFLPFWTIVQRHYKSYRLPVLLGGFLSMSLMSVGQGILLLVQIGLYEILSRFKLIRLSPMISMLIAVLGGQVLWRFLNDGMSTTPEVWMYVIYESLFAVVMLLFLDRLFDGGKGQLLRWNEEKTMAAVVFLSAILLGLHALQFMHLNLAILLFHVSVCIAAMVGGLSLSIVVATVVGLVFAVSELSLSGIISLYVITGLAVGVVAGSNRWVVATVSVLPSVFFYFYDATLPLDVVYFTSIASGVFVFLFLPDKLYEAIKDVMIPAQEKQLVSRYDWVTERLSESVGKLRSFSNFMSSSVQVTNYGEVFTTSNQYRSCEGCYKYSRCWIDDDRLQQAIQQYESATASKKGNAMRSLQYVVQQQCVKSDAFLKELQQVTYERELEAQLYHGRQMVALQLQKFSKEMVAVLEQLSDVQNELEETEEVLVRLINDAGIDCVQVDLVRDKTGNRLIICHVVEQVTPAFWIRIQEEVLPEISTYFGESLFVSSFKEVQSPFEHVQLRLTSSQQFTLQYEAYAMPHTHESGDVFSVFSLQEHLVGIVLSDGMGHGLEARQISEEMVRLLKGHLQHMEATTALHLMHYVVGLNNIRDVYASLDFLVIDKQTGELVYWKAGSVATYVLRRGRVIILENEIGPVGKSMRYQLECQRFKLLDGDVIFIVSDGIFHSRKDWLRQEQKFVQAIERHYDSEWSLASVLVNVMDDYCEGSPMEDDCTIIACRVEHLRSGWHAFTNVN